MSSGEEGKEGPKPEGGEKVKEEPKTQNWVLILVAVIGLLGTVTAALISYYKPDSKTDGSVGKTPTPIQTPAATALTIKNPIYDQWVDVKLDNKDKWAGFCGVAGSVKNIQPGERIFVFVHREKPFDKGWWRQQAPVSVKQDGEWTIPEVWFGDKDHPVAHGQIFDIQAVVAEDAFAEKLGADGHLPDEALSAVKAEKRSQRIRVHIGEVAR